MGLIVDLMGQPMTQVKPRANSGGMPAIYPAGGNPFPYDASSLSTQEMGSWVPWIRSPDAEINLYRDRMVARSRDLVRNDGWAAGGITRILDNTIGTGLRLSSSPDYRALAARSGITAFDAVWADEFRRAVEAFWRTYSEDINHWNDVSRQLTTGQQFRLAMRHKLIDGDALGVAYWFPDQVGYGGAEYATALLLVDPDRLSNPYQMMDTRNLRGGVEIDEYGAPIAHHIRKAQQNDWYLAVEANTWERVEKYDEDGWQRVFHDFDRDRASQHRGVGVFAPILAHAKMLSRYYGTELQAATIAATFATYVKSPYDPALIQDALGTGDDELSQLAGYQKLRAEWSQERPAMLNGARIPTLAPGESIEAVSSQHPHGNFGDFAHEMLRIMAAAAGVSAEQITQDWSRTNYSSARAALLEAWKTLQRRKNEFTIGFATPFYATWLHEVMDRNELPLPNGAPPFMAMRTAYSRCSWLGVGRGWIDPVKEKQGAQMGMEIGLSTLRSESIEQGLDWEESLDQRQIEVQAFKERGLDVPAWGAPEKAIKEESGSHDPDSPSYRSA